MRRRVGLFVVVTAAAGCVAALVVAHRHSAEGFGPLLLVAALTFLLSLTWIRPVRILWKEETEALQPDEAFFVASLLLLPPLGTVAVFAVALIVAHLVLKRPFSRLLFNVGQATLAASLGALAAHAVGGRGMAAVITGALVFLAVNVLSVSAVIAVADSQRIWRVLVSGWRFRGVVWGGSVALGAMTGLAGLQAAWAVPLAVVPLLFIRASLTALMAARQDRQRVERLLETASSAHASVSTEEVEAAIVASAKRLLGCRDARIGSPPAAGELGVPLVPDADLWLVVAERLAVGAFEPDDLKLLEAVAAVGTGALENARLVGEIRHHAFHDGLTGLPNQLLFEERAEYALSQRERHGTDVAVLVLDLDRFKKVNDALGHPVGNQLLQAVADRLRSAVRSGDTVARMGGDEFTVLLSDVDMAGAIEVATKIRSSFQKPFRVDGAELFVTTSVGIAITPSGGARPAELIKRADAAMYVAKQHGRDGFRLYEPDAAKTDDGGRLVMEAELHNAIAGGDLALYYQPQIDLATGDIVGMEALVRWPHPTRGLVPPDDFIGLAEEIGLIGALDTWVIRTACAQTSAWRDAGLDPVRVSVNVSAEGLRRPGLVETVMSALADAAVDPRLLEIEVTESAALDVASPAVAVLEAVRRLGVRLSIDDFGTGYSMLGRLRDLPVDELKIDRSFINEITTADDSAPIVTAMIAMAHGLGLSVVAEGVETHAHAQFLRLRGCDVAQGYLFSKPVPADEIAEMLRMKAGAIDLTSPASLPTETA